MGDSYTATIDVSALAAVGDHIDDVAALIDGAARTRLSFDGAVAGRAHVAPGDELRRALDARVRDLMLWARAAAEIGVAVRVGAHRYRDADADAAAGLR